MSNAPASPPPAAANAGRAERRFVLPYPPSLNRMYRAINGRQILSREGRAYKARTYETAIQAGGVLDCPVSVVVHLYRPAKRGDLDNSFKALIDSLSGVAYRDDSQIVELHAFRHDDKANPRAEVVVVPVGKD